MLAELERVERVSARLAGLSHELGALDDSDLEVVVHRLASMRSTIDALWLAALAAADDRSLHRRAGARDAAAWAASVAGERRGAAARDVALAGQLRHAPLVAEALASGTVSKAKSMELVQAASLPEEAQSALISEAVEAPVEQVVAAVRRARLEHGLAEAPVARR
jgi:hypothetical protein